MLAINMRNSLILLAAAILVHPRYVMSQSCGCAPNLCCSQWGYCGTGDAFCGTGCQEGPCYGTTPPPPTGCNCAPNLCCSQWGYCGTGNDYCGPGCQEGPCYGTTPPPPTGCNCAPNLCCSQWGYCGTGNDYCGPGCQEGPCYNSTTPPPPSGCNCSPNLCCSQYGYCGLGNDYCGIGCQAGPCYPPPTPNNVSVAEIVTTEFFNYIMNRAPSGCVGKSFYTRDAFLSATESYPLFGRVGSPEDSKREIAAAFAHFTHETGHFCYIEEINGPSLDYCDEGNVQYPCVPGKKYHGRGPIQLSWNYNYGPAGEDAGIGTDLLTYPETVGTNVVVSFKTACWFWVNRVQPYMVEEGFGRTIRAINSMECDGGNPATVEARVSYYRDYCSRFGVDPGQNLYC